MTVGVLLRHANASAAEAIALAGWQQVNTPFACDRVLLWNPRAPLDLPAWEPVLKWLDRWEVAIPFRPYTKLADVYGSKEERAATVTTVFDLRQPVYDSRVVLLRPTARTRKLIQTWTLEMQDEGDDDLALLRAIWKVKPLLLALPTGWVKA